MKVRLPGEAGRHFILDGPGLRGVATLASHVLLDVGHVPARSFIAGVRLVRGIVPNGGRVTTVPGALFVLACGEKKKMVKEIKSIRETRVNRKIVYPISAARGRGQGFTWRKE